MEVEEEVQHLTKRNKELPTAKKRKLSSLLLSDPLLAEVAPDATPEYLDGLIAQELGQAMTVFVVKYTGERIPLLVTSRTTVGDLKKQFQLVYAQQVEPVIKRKISWKYVWNKNCLMLEKVRLLDESARLEDLGMTHGSLFTFADYRPPDKRGRY